MEPLFPQFKKLQLEDILKIKNYTDNFPPYSDYNFVSIYSYNTQELIEFSFLNNNLVILFEDYITGEPFFSFLGNAFVNNTIHQLFTLATKKNILPNLQLIPEINLDTQED